MAAAGHSLMQAVLQTTKRTTETSEAGQRLTPLCPCAELAEHDASSRFWDLVQAEGQAPAKDFAAEVAAGSQFIIPSLQLRKDASRKLSVTLRCAAPTTT